MWFLLIFLKSRDVKTWCRTSKRSTSHRSGISWGTFCNQPEVSATSGSKVMAYYLFSHFKWAIIGYFSYYIDFNWPWPLTLTFDLDLDLHLFCKKKRNVVTSRDAKRRLAYKNGNHLPIGISSRINLQPTRSLYDFRFISYDPLCDFQWYF